MEVYYTLEYLYSYITIYTLFRAHSCTRTRTRGRSGRVAVRIVSIQPRSYLHEATTGDTVSSHAYAGRDPRHTHSTIFSHTHTKIIIIRTCSRTRVRNSQRIQHIRSAELQNSAQIGKIRHLTKI